MASNFLFSSECKIGPGDYNPNASILQKKSQAVTFRPPSVDSKPLITQHNNHIESLIGKRDDKIKALELK